MAESAEAYRPDVSYDPGDLARRIAARREELGLTRQQLARRARVSESYVEYLETQPAQPTPGALYWLAEALETTPRHLLGATLDRPPGDSALPQFSELVALEPRECVQLIAPGGVGRVAIEGNGPQIFPVNYALVEDEVIYRTRSEGPLAMEDGHPLGFEVDHLDEVMSRGWSVLISGRAERVTDPEIAQHLSGHVLLQPWAGGERELFIRVHPEQITGRRIVTSR